MACFDEQTIIRLLTGELESGQADAVLRHMESCSRCAELYNRYNHIGNMISTREMPSPPRGLARSIIASVSRSKAGNNALLPLPWIRPAAAFAIGAALFAAGLHTGRFVSRMNAPVTRQTTAQPSVNSYLVNTQMMLLEYTNITPQQYTGSTNDTVSLETAMHILEKTRVVRELVEPDDRELRSLLTEIEHFMEEIIISRQGGSEELEGRVRREIAEQQILLRLGRFIS